MKSEINYYPQVQLEKEYWKGDSFCPHCKIFSSIKLDEGEVNICQNCGKMKMVSVEYAIEIGMLEAEV